MGAGLSPFLMEIDIVIPQMSHVMLNAVKHLARSLV